MALTKAQLMELPGGVIPVGAIKAGTGISISNGVMAVDPTAVVYSVKPIDGSIDVSPASGSGDITISVPDQFFQNVESTVNPGDKMFFYNSTAPTGWTKVVSDDNLTIRVVSGTGGGVGGATPFTSAFTTFTPQGNLTGVSLIGDVQSHTINQGELPSHNHGYEARDCAPVGIFPEPGGNLARCQQPMGYTGGNGSHTHAFGGTVSGGFVGQTTNQFAVQYVDMILCVKN